MEFDTDNEAKTLASYRVPAVNMSGASSFDVWPDEIIFVADIEPPPEEEAKELAAALRAELKAKFG
jgi:hypothetical protein